MPTAEPDRVMCIVCNEKPAKTKLFCCSKSCSMKLQHIQGKRRAVKTANKKPFYERLAERHLAEDVESQKEEYRKRRVKSRLHTDLTTQKMAASEQIKKWNASTLGKSLEEIHGKEKAAEIRKAKSLKNSGQGNPMFGKTSKGGRSVKGKYKGHFFRSLLEYSFMKYLEASGHDITEDVLYEKIRIPIGVEHTYCADFYVKSIRTLYEVKPSRLTGIKENVKKFATAMTFCEQNNMSFRVVTEKDFHKYDFHIARMDPDVEFDVRTFRFFNRNNEE